MNSLQALLLAAAILTGCSATAGPCAPASDLPAIEARYQAELVAACGHFMPADPPTECPEYQAITDRARTARERWAACQR